MPYSTPVLLRQAVAPGMDWADVVVPPEQPSTHTCADMTDVQLEDAIAEADATINSYLDGRYATPVAEVDGSVPHPIDFWSRNIAAYNATLTYRQSQDFAETDPVVRRYNATMLQLTAVRDGKATLSIPPNEGTPGESAGAGEAINPYTGNLFSADDFNLVPVNPGWPFIPDLPSEIPGWPARW